MNNMTKNQASITTEYILSNKFLEITFSPFGASVRRIRYKKGTHVLKNIALTLPCAELYPENSLYAGATLGPTSGRIENGSLSINEKHFQLTKNERQKHHIHGGQQNLSFQFWDLTSRDDGSLTFSATLRDGVDGYSGNRRFEVTYLLRDNCLEIHQQALSDTDTVFNMSNHTYFNLNAFSASALDQYLTIRADRVIYNDEEHIPQETVRTAGTEFDFHSRVSIGNRIKKYPESIQFQYAKGLNHYFLLSKDEAGSPDCVLTSADKKTSLRLTTDAPALVLYSGGFIDGSFHYEGADGTLHTTYPDCAIAIEPSFLPFKGECPYAAKSFKRFIQWEFI